MQPGEWKREYTPGSVCQQFQTPVIVDFGSLMAGQQTDIYQNNALFRVPVGGTLYVKLSASSSYGPVMRPVLRNEEYGLPPFSAYSDDGWFSMHAKPAHGREVFKVCARIELKPSAPWQTTFGADLRYNPLFTCIRIQVQQHRQVPSLPHPPQLLATWHLRHGYSMIPATRNYESFTYHQSRGSSMPLI